MNNTTSDNEFMHYNYGIAKPIHIEEVCATPKDVVFTYENGVRKKTETVRNDWKVTPEKLPYLQCVQHYRRIELVHTGMRWLDIKRFGLSFKHRVGTTGVVELQTLDDRYAIQIPYQSIVAGFDPNWRDGNKGLPKIDDKMVDDSYVMVP